MTSLKLVTYENFVPKISNKDLVDRILAVGEAISEKKLYNYQIEFGSAVIEAMLMRDGLDRTILISRQAGKTFGLAVVSSAIGILFPVFARLPEFADDPRFNLTDDKGNYRGYRDGVRIGIYAPKQEQATIMFGAISQILGTKTAEAVLKQLEVSISPTGAAVWCSTGTIIRAETASENAKIEGDTYHMILTDESQDISDERMEKSLGPMLASTLGLFVKCGTANTKSNHFFRRVRANRTAFVNGGTRRHFEYNWIVAGKENSNYRKYVEQQMIEFGEFSDYFQQSYMCRFLLDRGMFITESVFTDPRICLRNPSISPFANRIVRPLRRPWSVVVGIDLAKQQDSTVCTAMAVNWDTPLVDSYTMTTETSISFSAYEKHIIDWFEIQGDDWETQYHSIMRYLSQFGGSLKKVLIDGTGVGDPVVDRFATSFDGALVDVKGYVFTPKSKSDLFRRLHVEFCGFRLSYPCSDATKETPEYKRFHTQMLDLQKEYVNNLMRCAAPPGPEYHDDFPCSLALANWAAENPWDGMAIESSDNMFFGGSR